MFPLNPSGLRTRDAGGIDRVHKIFEMPDTDVAEIRSFSVSDGVFPRLRPGDQVHLSSSGSSVYRRVVRVEPIAGGSILIWLDPGYVAAKHSKVQRQEFPCGKTSPDSSKVE